jgi:tRNA wybutosine-synthesizing protein 3
MNDTEMIDTRFEMLKKHHTQTLNDAISNGLVDAPIISFLEKIVTIPNIFTSSSCSGRIMLLIGDEDEKKQNSSFLKKYHNLVSFDELKKELANLPNTGVIWLKVEPFIFHFGVKDLKKAEELLSFLRNYGLKRAAIISTKIGKIVVEATNTVYLSTLIKKDDKLFVSEEYLKEVVLIANNKFKENEIKRMGFEKEFINAFLK